MTDKLKISKERFRELLDADTTEEVDRGSWRHGYTSIVKVEIDGVPYLTEIQMHPEDGMQLYADVWLTPAELVQVPTWRAKK